MRYRIDRRSAIFNRSINYVGLIIILYTCADSSIADNNTFRNALVFLKSRKGFHETDVTRSNLRRHFGGYNRIYPKKHT